MKISAMLNVASSIIFVLGASVSAKANQPTPPVANIIPKKLKKHGDSRIDNYFWLNERENPQVLKYVSDENKYVEQVMRPTKMLQENLIAEMRKRIKEDDESAPYKKGDYYYLTRYLKGAEYPVYLRRKLSLAAADEVILNVNSLAKEKKYFDVGALAVSHNQQRLVYAVDTVGRRFYDLHFKDLVTNKEFAKPIEATTGNFVWLNDNETILYTKQDPNTLRSFQLYKMTLGQKPILIYEEKDPQYYISVSKSLTQSTIFLYSNSNSAKEVRIASADSADVQFKIFNKRAPRHEYYVVDGGDRYFILTNDRAKNFKLMETAKNKTEKKYWKEVVAHRKNAFIEYVVVFKNHIVLEERTNGLTQLTYLKRGQKRRQTIDFPDATYMAGIGTNAEYDSHFFRYNYQSLTRPNTVFDFDFAKQQSVEIKTDVIPSYTMARYESHRVFAKAKDGTKIPISLVYKKSLFKKSANPLYVYGYGSYGLSTDSYFRSNVVSLLDRGFVFAIIHSRGGSEMGRKWYEDGKLLKKKNTFTDFIAGTEYLLKQGFGRKDHVYAMGGSAGGLLMGAIMNLRPDLYKGIIAAVPFVDVLTTMLDDTIPLTTNEYEEWGNPNDLKFYNYIKSYSPYDNVKKQSYPNLLITTGFHDSQVQYWEPLKWIAKLRQMNTSSNLLLMKTDMEAGHSGTTGRFASLQEDALDYAFFLMLEGISK